MVFILLSLLMDRAIHIIRKIRERQVLGVLAWQSLWCTGACPLALERCAQTGILVIDPVIYGEVGAICDSLEELDSLLPLDLFRRYDLI